MPQQSLDPYGRYQHERAKPWETDYQFIVAVVVKYGNSKKMTDLETNF